MKTEISSSWTFFFKFVFPVPFAAFSLNGAFSVWLGKSPPTNNEIPPAEMKFLLFAMLFLSIGFPIFLFGSLKRLRIDNCNLYISNYFKEIVVPISKISDVEEYLGRRLRPAKICFREATGFGTEVEFIPSDNFLPWRPSLVVAELRKLANLADF